MGVCVTVVVPDRGRGRQIGDVAVLESLGYYHSLVVGKGRVKDNGGFY